MKKGFDLNFLYYEVFPLLTKKELSLIILVSKSCANILKDDCFFRILVEKNYENMVPFKLENNKKIDPNDHKKYVEVCKKGDLLAVKKFGKNWRWIYQASNSDILNDHRKFIDFTGISKWETESFSYSGEWYNGIYKGIGIFVYKNNYDLYVGNFKPKTNSDELDDKGNGMPEKSGLGIYVFCNGNVYEGNYKKDVKTDIDATFYEAINTRTIKNVEIENEYSENEDLIHEKIKKCVNDNICTFSVTGTSCWIQKFYRTSTFYERTNGICESCYNNGCKMKERAAHASRIGLNFYCSCDECPKKMNVEKND